MRHLQDSPGLLHTVSIKPVLNTSHTMSLFSVWRPTINQNKGLNSGKGSSWSGASSPSQYIFNSSSSASVNNSKCSARDEQISGRSVQPLPQSSSDRKSQSVCCFHSRLKPVRDSSADWRENVGTPGLK